MLYRPELVAGQYTYFACDWYNYDVLFFTPTYYGNHMVGVITPTLVFRNMTSNQNRIITQTDDIQIYSTNSGVMIYGATGAPYSVHIMGIKLG